MIDPTTPIVTRFAPSPTGFLHIGGARTAFFNWLYARGRSGKMLLRIEDTDRQRSTKEAIDAIFDGLKWLGLDWDGEPVFQFERAGRHREIAEALLTVGRAYRCYTSAEELQQMREEARKAGKPPRYDGRWRDRDPSEAPPGIEPVIRLKAPTEGETVIDDLVQGRVTWQNKDLDDLVLLRSDGTPTYMLSVVVDDHDMAVTHIIRGDDHLTNGARQAQIYEALGWAIPKMAHIPLIHGPDGAKLSKRHGALGVEAYRTMGYLPAAMRNYLVRLGWSHGDQELFTTEELISLFDLNRVGRSAARFDFVKLENLNGQYIRQASDEELIDALEKFIPELSDAATVAPQFRAMRERICVIMPGLKERAKTLVELMESIRFLLDQRPLKVDDKAKAVLTTEARAVLKRAMEDLEKAEWKANTLDATVRALAEREKVKLAAVAQPLRAALTGKTTSTGIFDVLMALGKEESLARLADQIGHATVA